MAGVGVTRRIMKCFVVWAAAFAAALEFIQAEEHNYHLARTVCCEQEADVERVEWAKGDTVLHMVEDAMLKLGADDKCQYSITMSEMTRPKPPPDGMVATRDHYPVFLKKFISMSNGRDPPRKKALCALIKLDAYLPHELEREENRNFLMPSDFDQFTASGDVRSLYVAMFAKRDDISPQRLGSMGSLTREQAEDLPMKFVSNDSVDVFAKRNLDQPDKLRRALEYMFVTGWPGAPYSELMAEAPVKPVVLPGGRFRLNSSGSRGEDGRRGSGSGSRGESGRRRSGSGSRKNSRSGSRKEDNAHTYYAKRQVCCEKENLKHIEWEGSVGGLVHGKLVTGLKFMQPNDRCSDSMELYEDLGRNKGKKQFFTVTHGAQHRFDSSKTVCLTVEMKVNLPRELKREPNRNMLMPSDFEQFSKVEKLGYLVVSLYSERHNPQKTTYSRDRFSREDAAKVAKEYLSDSSVDELGSGEREEEPDKLRRAMQFMFVTGWPDAKQYREFMGSSKVVPVENIH